jgi:hypothetical protein
MAYRRASAVYTGAPASTPETATLPPTQIMAPAPAATPTIWCWLPPRGPRTWATEGATADGTWISGARTAGMRKRQRTRRDALLAALREQLPGARVQGVAAGLHLLITFPDLAGGIRDTDLAERLLRAGVLVHPLSWHRQLAGAPGLVLGYAAHTPDQLREAARRIARAAGG